MGYIGLIMAVVIALGVAGYGSFTTKLSTPTITETESGITSVLDSARNAAAQLEGKSSDDETRTMSDAVLSTDKGAIGTAGAATPGTSSKAVLPENKQTMLVAGGCFWCVEADLEKLPGVLTVVSGYAGGSIKNPTYENYAASGHKEVVEVTYDASRVSYEQILITP